MSKINKGFRQKTPSRPIGVYPCCVETPKEGTHSGHLVAVAISASLRNDEEKRGETRLSRAAKPSSSQTQEA